MSRTVQLVGLWLAACVLLAGACARAEAAALTGTPPATRFAPNIEAYPQNFDIAEDGASIVYLANEGGVLVFDGARWQLVRLPNRELARSLAYDGHDRVYVGGYNVLGYIQRDELGQPVFHDLTPKFKAFLKGNRFEDVWRICVTAQGVFFRSGHYLFAYDPASGKTRAWNNPRRFSALGVYRGEIVVQFRGEGFKRLHDGQWQALPGAAVTGQVYGVASLPDDGLLMFGPDGAWRVYRDGVLSDYPVPAGFPPSTHFSNALALADGTLVLAASDGYLYFVSADGRQVRRMRLDSGYLSDVIQGNDGGLLVSADSGMYHVAWPSSWTTIGPETGFSGPFQLSHWRGRWQVLTSAGVFESAVSPDATGVQFAAVNWTPNEAWDLLPLDPHDALLAESYGVKLVHDGIARPITHTHLYPRLLLRSRFDSGLVYVGTEEGIASLRKGPSGWKLELDQENMNALRVSSLVEVSPGRLWAGSERGGLHLLQLSADGERVASDQAMGHAQGLDYGDKVHGVSVAQLADGSIVASTAAGEFRWRNDHFERDALGGLDSLRERGEWVTLQAIGDTLWAFSYNHIYRRDGRGGHWRSEPIGHLLQGAIQNLYADADGTVAFVASGNILCFHPVASSKPGAPPQVMLRGVTLTQANGERRHVPLDKPLELVEGEQTLKFDFALPDYSAQDGARFKAALIGFENVPDEWGDSREFTYSHLRPVNYSFELLGRDAQGHVTEAPRFRIRVIPRWYARTWVIAAWLVLAALCLFALIAWYIRWRTRSLQLDRLRLEDMVAERTLELERANRQLETMAHLDSLTGLPNRRRLDSYLEVAWPQAIERQRSMSILAIDADHFKRYNDLHGHPAGDQLLTAMAAVLSRCLRRAEDFIARYGGEEFLAILPGADGDTARAIAESMRAQVAQAELGVTISVGVASCVPGAGSAASCLINEADAALYRAKAAGRNLVVAATDDSMA